MMIAIFPGSFLRLKLPVSVMHKIDINTVYFLFCVEELKPWGLNYIRKTQISGIIPS